MNPRRVEITLDQQTWDKLESARLREPRASFVKRALESALGDGKGAVHQPAAPAPLTQPSPASSRAPRPDPAAPSTMAEAAKRATGTKTPSVASTWRR